MSAIFILDSKGKVRLSIQSNYVGLTSINIFLILKVLISRNYRGDVEMSVVERFMQLLLEQEDESNLTPIVQHGDVAFIYIKHTNVYRTNFNQLFSINTSKK